MLPSWIGAQLAGVAGQFLKDTCTIWQEFEVKTPTGGVTSSPQVVAAGVACRVIKGQRLQNSAVGEQGGQETFEQMYLLEVGQAVALAADQSVTVGTETYQIIRVETALTDRLFRSALMVQR